jgi:hypothetical protein
LARMQDQYSLQRWVVQLVVFDKLKGDHQAVL